MQEEEDRRVARGSGAEREGAGTEPPLRGGGLRLPGLRRWRLRRGLTQQRLAERAGLDQRQLSKIETGRRGCNPAAARRLAGELGVDVAMLRVLPREQEMHPAKSRAPRRNLHRAYLGVLLGREVGSAYTVMGEEALERHCKGLSWEGVLGVTSGRRREARVLGELLGGTALPEEVRPFLEEVLGTYPDRDIRLLATARGREDSEEGREGLTRAMREFL